MLNASMLHWRAFKRNKEAVEGLQLRKFDQIRFAVARIC